MLALDVGSSSVRAQRFDEDGIAVGELRREAYETDDADALAALVRRVLDGAEPDAISSFGHSLIALDGHGRPLTPVLGWRDVRSAPHAKRLRTQLDAAAVHARTGQPLHPSYWPAKLAWLAETEPAIFAAAARFVSFADHLSGEPVTSLSLASGTGLLNLERRAWDEELLDTLGIDVSRLPELSEDLPLWIDGACSNLGSGCTGARAALSVGTSGALRIVHDGTPRARPGLFTYLIDGDRIVEGGALSDGGNLRAWLERMFPTAGEARDDHGLTVLPFLGGERSTGWDPDATGAIAGLSLTTTAADIRRAALEGVAFRFAAILDLLPEVEEIVASGGGLLHDPAWIQLMADGLGRPLLVSGVAEASLRGAAVALLERHGVEPAPAPVAGVFRPRPERAGAYRSAREEQARLYEVLRGEH